MKTIITIILGILLLGSVSAIDTSETIYAGECLSVDLGNMTSLENVVYDVVGNSSNMTGMNITLEGEIAEVCFAVNYKPDNFTLIFIDNSTKEVIVEVKIPSKSQQAGGGGSSYTKTKPIEVVNETIEEEIKVNDTIEEELIIINEVKKSNKKYWIIGGILILIIGGYLVLKIIEW